VKEAITVPPEDCALPELMKNFKEKILNSGTHLKHFQASCVFILTSNQTKIVAQFDQRSYIKDLDAHNGL
jgi:hypothetical protein